MVAMMILRPEGLWPSRRVQLEIRAEKEEEPLPAPAAGS
jgi:hypothetical protein